MKTNKSYAKRIKVTKDGKILVRKPGICHFNAKESRESQLKKRSRTNLPMSTKAQSRFLTGIK